MLRFLEQLPHRLTWFFTNVRLKLNPLSSASEVSQGSCALLIHGILFSVISTTHDEAAPCGTTISTPFVIDDLKIRRFALELNLTTTKSSETAWLDKSLRIGLKSGL